MDERSPHDDRPNPQGVSQERARGSGRKPLMTSGPIPREKALAFLEALAATVTPTPEQEMSQEEFLALLTDPAKTPITVELYDDDRILLARGFIR
jgi:hypothetical protein